ncbi:ankyrin [Auricularia subglabra TFB-10046 SS5]|nr:ankyrin [Auricularia subglabra TFB-10046 SS5]
MATPSADELENVLEACRYGELDELKDFVNKFGPQPLGETRDANGNTVLHMAAANGHTEILDVLLPIVPASLLSVPNNAGSTPLHWAALNAQLATTQKLVALGGAALIDARNKAGRTPLAEAELAGWDEGARWLVDQMDLEAAPPAEDTEENIPAEDEGAPEEQGPVEGVPKTTT